MENQLWQQAWEHDDVNVTDTRSQILLISAFTSPIPNQASGPLSLKHLPQSADLVYGTHMDRETDVTTWNSQSRSLITSFHFEARLGAQVEEQTTAPVHADERCLIGEALEQIRHSQIPITEHFKDKILDGVWYIDTSGLIYQVKPTMTTRSAPLNAKGIARIMQGVRIAGTEPSRAFELDSDDTDSCSDASIFDFPQTEASLTIPEIPARGGISSHVPVRCVTTTTACMQSLRAVTPPKSQWSIQLEALMADTQKSMS